MSTTEAINLELAACWEMCCDAVGIDTDATAAEWCTCTGYKEKEEDV